VCIGSGVQALMTARMTSIVMVVLHRPVRSRFVKSSFRLGNWLIVNLFFRHLGVRCRCLGVGLYHIGCWRA